MDFAKFLNLPNTWRVASNGFFFSTKFWWKIANQNYCTPKCKVHLLFFVFLLDYISKNVWKWHKSAITLRPFSGRNRVSNGVFWPKMVIVYQPSLFHLLKTASSYLYSFSRYLCLRSGESYISQVEIDDNRAFRCAVVFIGYSPSKFSAK